MSEGLQSAAKGGYRVGSGPKPKADDGCAPGYTPDQLKVNDGKYREPLEFMLDTVNDPAASMRRRDMMAVASASFKHPRILEQRKGKKEVEREKAKEHQFFMPPPTRQPSDNPLVTYTV
jgi:hypothetical protein